MTEPAGDRLVRTDPQYEEPAVRRSLLAYATSKKRIFEPEVMDMAVSAAMEEIYEGSTCEKALEKGRAYLRASLDVRRGILARNNVRVSRAVRAIRAKLDDQILVIAMEPISHEIDP